MALVGATHKALASRATARFGSHCSHFAVRLLEKHLFETLKRLISSEHGRISISSSLGSGCTCSSLGGLLPLPCCLASRDGRHIMQLSGCTPLGQLLPCNSLTGCITAIGTLKAVLTIYLRHRTLCFCRPFPSQCWELGFNTGLRPHRTVGHRHLFPLTARVPGLLFAVAPLGTWLDAASPSGQP